MKKEFPLARRIRGLVPGHSFTVKTEQERQAATKAANTLRLAGVIDFRVVTRETETKNGFTVARI